MTGKFIIEILASHHYKKDFSCGNEALDRYFANQASQDVKRRVSGCYVAIEKATGRIAGYYTLSASGIPLEDMPEGLAKKLPRYPIVPVACLGRLAVDKNYHGQKLGAALLWDSIQRALRSEVVVFALVVDAKDDQARNFYLHHGFSYFSSTPNKLILPLANYKNI
ncbi:Acetyltransferase (GNAT) domain-containing protein [Methylomagnum ishizawai]|uniref:Acetyltransferase (GNAT) domain-containing protein n=1 Tax=Methylomagnum ishizawai TaxID=1760988 RepID=A0A1Y6D5M6_9GAMM|nr:GNAT family N-acetyltransferase [Methylomagnum ishizawai]SMF97911.1 Acetyltransferase (GNAT) domain-containing protein [Methylomagnum ishizawai]